MNEANSLVSIIIPTYNRAELIEETLHSVKNQTYQNWECIVVDDGSADDTVERVRQMAKLDDRIQVICRDAEPKGACTCRNTGLLASKGGYVIFLDSDDLLATFCLQQRVEFMEANPAVDMGIFPQLIFKKTPGDSKTLINIPTGENALNRFFTLEFCLDVPWVNSAPIISRNALMQKNILWDNGVKGYQDIVFHVDCLLQEIQFQYAKLKPDYYYRMHQGDRVGKKIFSEPTLISTEKFLFNFYQRFQAASLLSHELRLRMIKSLFYGVIEKWLRLGNPTKSKLVAKEMRNQRMVSAKMYYQLLLYIFMRSSALKKLGPKINRMFNLCWKNSIYKKTEYYYLKCEYN